MLHFYKKIDELVNIFKIFIGILSGENPKNMELCGVGGLEVTTSEKKVKDEFGIYVTDARNCLEIVLCVKSLKITSTTKAKKNAVATYRLKCAVCCEE